MNAAKIREVISIYRRKFEEMEIPKKEVPHDRFPASREEALAHCHAMLDQMDQFLTEGRLDKVFRWLGFAQGCFWTSRFYTVSEMKNHNRP